MLLLVRAPVPKLLLLSPSKTVVSECFGTAHCDTVHLFFLFEFLSNSSDEKNAEKLQ